MEPETVEQLGAELKTHAATIESLEAAVSKPDASAEDIARFDEATAKFAEVKGRYDALRAQLDNATLAGERAKRAKEIRDQTDKFNAETIQNPNWGREQRRTHDRMASDEGFYQDTVATAVNAWATAGLGEGFNDEQKQACITTRINPAKPRLDPGAVFNPRQLRHMAMCALQATGSMANLDGAGYGAATGYADSRDNAALGFTNRGPEFIQQVATTMITYGGIMNAPITIETADHLAEIVETYVTDQVEGRQIGEGQTIGTNQNPTSKNLIWKYWKFTSDDITISDEQLQATRLVVPGWVWTQLGERLGRKFARDLTNGEAIVNPQGITVAATKGGKYFTSLTTNVIGYDDLHSGLPFAIDEVFRSSPAVGWMMSEPVMQYLMRMKDLEGRPMLNWGWEGMNRLRTLEGRPVYVNRNMITTYATTQKPILYGDYSKFKVVFRNSMIPTLIRDETTLRREGKTIFTALSLMDSRLVDYGNCPIAELRIL